VVLKEHFNFYSSHFFDRALVLLLKFGFLVLYTVHLCSIVLLYDVNKLLQDIFTWLYPKFRSVVLFMQIGTYVIRLGTVCPC